VVSKAVPAPAAPAPKRQQQQPWVDIDEQNKDNPLACSEYAESIFTYLNTCEVSTGPVTASSSVLQVMGLPAVQL
jgi:hypothetical protein